MTWLTVIKTAEILDVTPRAVRMAVAVGKYTSRYVEGVGRAGRQLQIALESLPADAQALYRGEQRKPQDILQFTGKQRDKANEKAWIVEQYHQWGLSPDKFVSKFNAENPPEDAITKSNLFRWQRKYRNREVADLIDQRGGHNRDHDTIPQDAWDDFYALYMTQQQRSISLCYDLTKRVFPDIPSYEA